MSIKSFAGRILAWYTSRKIKEWDKNAVEIQNRTRAELVHCAAGTLFGLEHKFKTIKTYEDFVRQIPIREYEDFSPYIKKVLHGDKDILWKGVPAYLAKTSGTTSGVKYIPLTKEAVQEQTKAAKNALLMYIAETGKSDFIDGKWIFLQGSPKLEEKNGIKTGRLSGISAHFVPSYLQTNRLPSWETNCIEDWETKVNAITEETIPHKMTLIAGIPPWLQMYFDRLTERTGKKVKDIFPNFSVMVYGGVNFEPYRAKLEQSIGKRIDSVETYPASEGFFAFQDSQKDTGLLLNVNGGIFYEFIRMDDYFSPNPKRLWLQDIELGVNYALIISTNAGLWAYSIGDTVKFVSKNPYRIVVTGRIKHFISAFGEHVIAEEVEASILDVANKENVDITEFAVAPNVNPTDSALPYHEWFVEFGNNPPKDLEAFAHQIDKRLQQKNIYYKDLIEGKVLRPLVIRSLPKNSFIDYMRSEGKLGGQNKVPRLSNDRKIADKLQQFLR